MRREKGGKQKVARRQCPKPLPVENFTVETIDPPLPANHSPLFLAQPQYLISDYLNLFPFMHSVYTVRLHVQGKQCKVFFSIFFLF